MISVNNKFLIFVVLFIFGISGAFSQTPTKGLFNASETKGFAAANLSTEKNSYRTGENVVVNGSGFGKFEPITMRVEQFDDNLQQQILRGTWLVYADARGNFVSNWELPGDGKFTITGTGDKSGQEVQTVIQTSVTPVFVSGNPSCATLNASTNPAFAHITSNFGFKVDPPASGTFPYTNGAGRELTGGAPSDPSNSLTIDILNSSTFDWTSTRPISAVIVKGGPNANVFAFNPGSFGDTDLYTVGKRFEISHIEVCFGAAPATITIIKDAQPNSAQAFSFSATGQVNQNFSLVDNGVIGPDRKLFTNLTAFGAGNTVTVTEGASAPFSLVQISCTSNGSGIENNSVSLGLRAATIQLEAGENVVCTFVNSITTASTVAASGRVTDTNGQGLTRVRLMLLNTATSETVTTYSNSFGYYRFDGLEAGGFYVIYAQSKNYVFEQDSLSFTLYDALEDLNFTASPQ